MSGEETASLEEIVKRLRRKKAQGAGINHRHRSVGMSIAQATGILAQGDIPRVMEATVKLPGAANEGQSAPGRGSRSSGSIGSRSGG
jgi:hypothetical protein